MTTRKTYSSMLFSPLKKLSDNDDIFSLCLAMMILAVSILALPPVTADTTYKYAGFDRPGWFDLEGVSHGQWSGVTPHTSFKTFSTVNSYFPLVGDVDNDSSEEIIVIADSTLYRLNFSNSSGILTEGTNSHGATSQMDVTYRITPALFDYNGDGVDEVISSNISHMLIFGLNSSGTFTLLNSSSTGLQMTSTGLFLMNKYPEVKCIPALQSASGNAKCLILLGNKTGGTINQTMIAYNPVANTVQYDNIAIPNSNNRVRYEALHLYDGNNDGFLEAYWAYQDTTNFDLYVYATSINASGYPITGLIYTQSTTDNFFSDIVVSNLGEPGMTYISWAFCDPVGGIGTECDVRAIHSDGSNAVDFYSGSPLYLSNPEGDSLASNGLFSNNIAMGSSWTGSAGNYPSACYYIHNYAQTSPAAYNDTVMCASKYSSGNSIKSYTIAGNAWNYSTNFFFHMGDFAAPNDQGILTPRYITIGSTKLAQPSLGGNYDVVIPADEQNAGQDDFIGLNSTVLAYFDDGYTNEPFSVDSILGWKNPTCQNAVITYTSNVSDAEGDLGTCYLNVAYTNGTEVGNYSVQSMIHPPATLQFYYTASLTGTFFAKVFCKDNYHAYNSLTWVQTVVNTTPCYDEPASTPVTPTPSNVTCTGSACDTSLDDAMDDLFGASTKMKAIAGIGIIIGIMVGVGQVSGGNPIAVIVGGLLGTILVTYLGFISAYILILILAGLILLIIISRFVAPNIGQGGH